MEQKSKSSIYYIASYNVVLKSHCISNCGSGKNLPVIDDLPYIWNMTDWMLEVQKSGIKQTFVFK